MKRNIILVMLIFLVLLCPIANINKIFAEENFNQTNYDNYILKNETEYYRVNKTKTEIEHISNNETSYFAKYGVDATKGEFTEITFLRILKNDEFSILDNNLSKLHFFDKNFNFIKTIEYISYNGTYKKLGNISFVTEDIYSNLYLIDTTNNCILKVNSSQDYFEVINSSFTFHTDSKISILDNKNNFVLFDSNTLILMGKTKILSENIVSMFVDAYNFIYLIYDNRIEKYDSDLTLKDTLFCSCGKYININLEDGKIFYISDDEIKVIDNFISNTLTYSHPTDAMEKVALSDKIETMTTKNKIFLLSTPYSTSSDIVIESNEKVILLGKTLDLSSTFSYILYSKNDETHLGYTENKNLSIALEQNTNESFTPSRKDVSYYKYPQSNFVTLGKLEDKSYTSTRKIIFDNKNYIEIKENDKYIYVLEQELVSTSLEYVDDFIQTNAKITPNGEKEIKLYYDKNMENLLTTLSDSKNVEIIEEFENTTKIKLILDNNIIECFVDSKNVQYGNNIVLPITILLAFVCITLFIILTIKLKKESIKRKNNL